ncbi:Gellan lyase precursor [compost metagenome]
MYDVLDIYAAAYDGIAINVYPGGLQTGVPEFALKQIKELHDLTGKPVMITEWSVPALDSGLYNNPSNLDFSYPENVDTQTERARQAAYVTAQLYNLPYVVGSHWFIWYDFNDSSRKANRGIYKEDGLTPWPEVKSALTNINGQIIGSSPVLPSSVFNPSADAYVRGGTAYQNVNYGTSAILNVKDSPSVEFDRRSYLKFQLDNSSLTSCTSAILKVHVSSLPNGNPVTIKAFGISDDSWTETGIKWSNMPSLGSQLSSVSMTSAGTVYAFDVTAFVSTQLAGDGVVSIALTDNAGMNKEVQMDSREGAVKPVLEVTY